MVDEVSPWHLILVICAINGGLRGPNLINYPLILVIAGWFLGAAPTLVTAHGGIDIHAIFPAKDGQKSIDIFLATGETFGGRTFGEWQLIASGRGTVDADWLKVWLLARL